MPEKPKQTELIKQPPGDELGLAAPTPMSFPLIERALASNVPVETIERLVALHERVAATEAASEFAAEMARFQRDRPEITQNAELPHIQVTRAGVKRAQRYATLNHIRKTIQPHLGSLSIGWDTEYPDKDTLIVTCTVTHPLGHSKTAQYKCPITGTSAMTEQQKVKSAISYGNRVSLTQVLALTECDEDLDGADEPDPVTAAQATELEALAGDVGADTALFLRWVGVETFAEIPASKYAAGKAALEKKGREQA